MPESFVVSGVRTPIGRYGGALAHVRPDDLAALVVGEAVARAGIAPELVDEVVLGAANQAGEDNRNVARMALLLAGLPDSVPGFTVNRLCASGLTAVATARALIAAGDADVVVAGGVESMTRAPWVTEKPAKAFAKPGPSFDTSIGWRFTNPRFDAATTASMPQTAETVARRWGLTREELDAYALRSHERAVAAIKEGRFTGEIVPVPTDAGVVDTDEGPRPDTSLERLARLRPVNGPDGVVTAGNSSSLNDGAAAVVVVSDRFLERHGLTPRARLVAAANAGVAPEIMGVGPVPATRKALERAGGRRGLATMCVGVGQGSALLVERP
ncbi:thiolase family protein [Nonomuraea sp. NPDC050451]|uniref:thiolase family protein n=1 Tax=Nonomuraea sp. NPDC050451 TaxID=3364364 RepID=UPI0037BA39CA